MAALVSYCWRMDGGNNPFSGFETIRAAMRGGGRGPTWTLVAVGAHHADAIRAPPQLVAEVAADPGAPQIAREMCLQRAATDPSPDLWLDAAGAIADARTDVPVR